MDFVILYLDGMLVWKIVFTMDGGVGMGVCEEEGYCAAFGRIPVVVYNGGCCGCCHVSRGACAFGGLGWRAQSGFGHRQMKTGFGGCCVAIQVGRIRILPLMVFCGVHFVD